MDAIVTFSREEFLADYWSYTAGEHVTFLGRTGSGKTHLKWQVLAHTATPEVPALVLASKPKDATTTKWSKSLGFRVVRSWPAPPDPRRLIAKPAGRVLWPKHTFDPDHDDAVQAAMFRAAMLEAYRRGNQIIDVDEMLDMKDLKLETEMRTLWTRGRSMGTGIWAGTQQPFHVPTHAYRQAEHLFIGTSPDKRSRERYDEIGDGDSRQISAWVMNLKKHQFLYIRRTGPAVCIVDK